MSVTRTQTQTTYSVEYKDKEYAVIETTHHFNDYTDYTVYLEGEEVEPELADAVLMYLGDQL